MRRFPGYVVTEIVLKTLKPRGCSRFIERSRSMTTRSVGTVSMTSRVDTTFIPSLAFALFKHSDRPDPLNPVSSAALHAHFSSLINPPYPMSFSPALPWNVLFVSIQARSSMFGPTGHMCSSSLSKPRRVGETYLDGELGWYVGAGLGLKSLFQPMWNDLERSWLTGGLSLWVVFLDRERFL